MPSRRRPNPTHAAPMAILVLVVGLLLSASAQAATVSEQVYTIVTTDYRAEVAFSATQMKTNLTAAQRKLAATATSIEALSSSHATAATALVDELENQYDAAVAFGLFKPALREFTALAKLALPRIEHKAAVADEASVKRTLAINTRADLKRWQAAGFVTGREPADTKQFGGIVGISLPSIAIPITGTSSAIKTFIKLDNEASHKTTTVFDSLSSDWSAWAAGFGVESG